MTPTKQEWQELYEAAQQFKASECWSWMYDIDVFAVEDPQTHQLAYCSIMGNAGELVGIAVYYGAEGLQNITELILGVNDPEDFRYTQQCLMLCYGDRAELASEDLKVIKSLGLKFRGKGQWPQFQDYSPGKVPWFITGPQCRFLNQVIRQALVVAANCKEEKSILTTYPAEHKMLARVMKKDWQDEYREVLPLASFLSLKISDELLLKKLEKLRVKRDWILEVEIFSFPMTVAEEKGQRPYFPRLCTFVDHHSGMVLSYKSFANLAEEGHICLDGLIETISNMDAIPAQILVRKEETFYFFKDACRQLQIDLVKVEELEVTAVVKEGLFEFMS